MNPRISSPFRDLPFMGVIYVVVEAMKLGYSAEDPEWTNLGQGQPEVGPLQGAPERVAEIQLQPSDHAYGPVEGLPALRELIAAHYNRLFRSGKSSQYGAENVVVAAGGRTTITRTIAALDAIRLGYFTPDYTAYEDVLTAFSRVQCEHIPLSAEQGFAISPDELTQIVKFKKLQALLISNPCNPTGRAIQGNELKSWVQMASATGCALLMDEYYSHYIWNGADRAVSSAQFVDDVNSDPVIVIDGLTKNYRYPGWRLGWAIGPRDMVRRITAAGSFIDGGPPRPVQRAALEVLQSNRADQETAAVRRNFGEKRDEMLRRLKSIGIEFPCEPEGTFYAFGSVARLKPPFNSGQSFFREALKHRVMTVPGEFFDVNPHKTRKDPSPLRNFVRFSFGPPMPNMIKGLERLEQMVRG
ncbi:MAG: pyridoxal phosphate-dependent aminotransferase [Oligoflexia bacterium]|nr:pyridoxal phosphate-dependent aminotransferase [Oligoflexia bacterium]